MSRGKSTVKINNLANENAIFQRLNMILNILDCLKRISMIV